MKVHTKILLVEDDPDARELIQCLLSEQGYQIIETAAGQEALSAWRREPGQIDMLLTDIKLTPEMSGQGLAKTLRQRAPDLPVLFLSGYDQTTHADWIDQWPGCSYLQKPYRASALIEAVEAVLKNIPLQIG